MCTYHAFELVSASTLKLVGSESTGAAQFLLATVQSHVITSRNNILATERPTWKKRSLTNYSLKKNSVIKWVLRADAV